MAVIVRLAASLGAALAIYLAYKVVKLIYNELTSPLRDLRGPKSSSFMYGNLKDIWEAENSVLHEKWVEEYGSTIRYRAWLGVELYTTDTRALNHVLMNSYIYQKPDTMRYHLSEILGAGVLVTEEDKHKQQRKVMNPAFGQAQIRELTEIFVDKSIQLRDIWMAESSEKGGTARIDVMSWLSRTTLDVIGKAGFGYDFEALNSSEPNELSKAFALLFGASTKLTIVPLLRAWFPFLRFLPAERDAEMRQARSTMSRIGHQLLEESKASIQDKSSRRTRDLLSLLIKANMSTDILESQRLSDEDVLAQVPTFLVAGHETTSVGTTWALYALTQSPKIQTKLREELFTIDTDNPTMDQLNALPYLDMVVRETLRVYAPVPSTIRIAMKDDLLPVNTPFTDRKGKVHHEIRINKGQTLMIPILAINRDKSIWGEDSMEFRPERWESVPEVASNIPGVWGNMLTFLGGPRACIGYRFSLVETKALLFTLIRAFEFELAVPASDIIRKTTIVQRPLLRSDKEAGSQLPLLVRPFSSTDS